VVGVQVVGAVTAAPGRFFHKLVVVTPDGQRRTVQWGPLVVVNT
jgi:hypothetical protein